MDFFKCEARRKILVFESGKLFFFGLCVLAIFVPFHFPFTER